MMEQGFITCPECDHEFEISDVLTSQIRDKLKAEMQQEVLEREKEVKKKADALKAEREAFEEDLAKQEELVQEQVNAAVQQKLKQAETKAAKAAEARFSDQVKELQETLAEKEESEKALKKNEMAVRKKMRELEQAQENMELENQRKLDEERQKIRQEAEQKFIEQHRLKDMEKEKLITDLKNDLDDMKRKAEQGSMETQGEVLEQDFERRLQDFFRSDQIQPVPKGIRGADLVHTVRTQFGVDCGNILWEMKNTKNWSQQWVTKLKEDATEIRADIMILVTVALPVGIERFGSIDGVWVCDPLSAIPLAAALREQIVAIDRERQAAVGKNDKMEMLHQYLVGSQFKQKIEGIVESFNVMQEQIIRERRAMEKQWKEREKAVERVIKNTVGLYGDMQGIIGGQIPSIPALEMDYVPVKSLELVSDEAE